MNQLLLGHGVSGFIRGFNFLIEPNPESDCTLLATFKGEPSQTPKFSTAITLFFIVGAGPVGSFSLFFSPNLVFRKLDGLAEEIQRSQPPIDLWRKFIYCTSLTGSILGSVDHMHPQGFEKFVSPISVAYFSQYKLTRLLVKLLENLAFRICTSEGKLMTRKIQSKILVGADGAGSTIPFYPPQQTLEDFSPEICKKLIFKLVGRELSDIDVIDVKPWVMHAEVAERFVWDNNQIILCGDAAHRFPPAGGFGMNTGVQDAHNLAWKIASLLKGFAPSAILATYETEPLSVQNFRAAMAVPATLGLDPTVANSGNSQLSEFILNENNPLGSSRLSRLGHIFEERKSLQLQFPAEDLGFRDYVPCADPGSMLPHMNVKVLSNFLNEETISTLDLVSGDKVEFLLMIAPVEESYNLAQAAFKVAKEYKVSTKVYVLWPAGTVTRVQSGSRAKLAPCKIYIDVIEVKASSDSLSWWRNCHMMEQGAILVRPDEHIAWRSKSSVVGHPYPEMKMVFSTILGIESSQPI
ncbi:hypothetical protein CRYUN_Cryun04dG0159100 [Craigia yunnanensis]